MRRRDLLLAAVLISGPVHAQPSRPARIGYLSGGDHRANTENTIEVLKAGLAELGWRVGTDLTIEERWASGDFSRLRPYAQELAALNLDVIVATGSHETKSLQEATDTTPIVFMQVLDPIALGVVSSIARPGKNITGLTQGPQVLWGKRLDLLAEVLGRAPAKLAWLGNPGNAGAETNWSDAQDAARRIGASIERHDVSDPTMLDNALRRLGKADALLVQWDFLLAVLREEIARRVVEARLPAIYENRSPVEAGGLMSYGADLRENYRRGANYVHRILKGEKPANLPVVQASRFELVLNQRAAQQIGLVFPTSLIVRADEVIE